jgi:hypothetical protein
VELELRAVRLARLRHRRPTRRPKVSGPRAAAQHALRTQRAPRQQRRPVDGVQVRHVCAIFRNFLRKFLKKKFEFFVWLAYLDVGADVELVPAPVAPLVERQLRQRRQCPRGLLFLRVVPHKYEAVHLAARPLFRTRESRNCQHNNEQTYI